jgi:hypothetical protein
MPHRPTICLASAVSWSMSDSAPRSPPKALGLHPPRLRPRLRHRRHQLDRGRAEEGNLPGPSNLAPSQGLDRGADQAWPRRLAGRAGSPAQRGHRAGRGRCRRGPGGVQAPAGRLAAHGDTIRVKHTLRPLGVARPPATCTTRTRTEGPRERPLSRFGSHSHLTGTIGARRDQPTPTAVKFTTGVGSSDNGEGDWCAAIVASSGSEQQLES